MILSATGRKACRAAALPTPEVADAGEVKDSFATNQRVLRRFGCVQESSHSC
jgi:hypothetical protein